MEAPGKEWKRQYSRKEKRRSGRAMLQYFNTYILRERNESMERITPHINQGEST
jgi:hypothetical protein